MVAIVGQEVFACSKSAVVGDEGLFFELVLNNNGWFSKSTYILFCKTLADDGGQLHREVFRQDLRTFSQKCIEAENRCMSKGASKDTVPTKNVLASSKTKL